ncbi:hypothetical protein GCM10027343_25100 [Noviherbaspirillum agri]
MTNLKNQRLEIGLIVLIVIVSVLLVFSGWRTLNDHREYIAAEERINHVNEQLRALNLTLSAFQDAEIGQRGYLLTSNPRYLEPYENALKEIDARLDWLARGLKEESRYQLHLAEINRIKIEKLDELHQTVVLHKQGRHAAALAMVNSDRGKLIMDRLRMLSGEMVTDKRAELARIKQTSVQRGERAEHSTYLFGASIALFMALAYAYLLFDLRERGRLTARAEFAENHDELTGLHNGKFFRDLLSSHVRQGYREGTRIALVFVNLDNFKSVNQEFGFVSGNQVLIEIASRLAETARKGEAVARLRNDEFAIMVSRANSIEDLSSFAGRLIDALTPSLIPEMPEKYLGFSIGIAIYPDDASSAGQLLDCANEAVAKAKTEGRARYRFFRETVDTAPTRAQILTSGLHRAVERKEFELRFQPQVDARTHRIVGVETLLRWTHPELGVVSPDEFIPIAEKTGLILPIGVWVLREACKQVQQWNLLGANWVVAVNVSAAELLGEDFVQVVSDALAESGLPAHQLEIEITERALMSERAAQELSRIKQLGVQVSIDDFGTGYSSLSYLTRLSVDALKIDKSFVTAIPGNAKDCSIVRTIINIGKELNIKVIAEGVETRDQAHFLRDQGCDIGQGYLFHKPRTADEIDRLLGAVSYTSTH